MLLKMKKSVLQTEQKSHWKLFWGKMIVVGIVSVFSFSSMFNVWCLLLMWIIWCENHWENMFTHKTPWDSRELESIKLT